MICRACQVAGWINVEANRKQFFSVADAEKIRVLARLWHKRCKRKGCICQHAVGRMTRNEETNGTRPAELDGEPLLDGV